MNAATTCTQTRPQQIGMDMAAPFGVYLDGACVAEYATEAQAQQHFDRLRATGYKPQPNQALALMQQAQTAIKVAAKKRMANTSAQPSK